MEVNSEELLKWCESAALRVPLLLGASPKLVLNVLLADLSLVLEALQVLCAQFLGAALVTSSTRVVSEADFVTAELTSPGASFVLHVLNPLTVTFAPEVLLLVTKLVASAAVVAPVGADFLLEATAVAIVSLLRMANSLWEAKE